MTRPAASASARPWGLPTALVIFGHVCLAVITLSSPGATRMFAWPWSLAYAGTLLAPVLALIARAFDINRPLALPSRAWCLTALAAAAVILLSALSSPFRGPSLLWAAPLLAAVAFFFVLHDALQSSGPFAARAVPLVGLAVSLIVLTSIALWLPGVAGRSLDAVAFGRNPFPLGHANYTAGLALLAVPWLASLAWSARGLPRLAWSLASLLAFVMFLGSGSRAGMVGLAALAFAALLLSPLATRRKLVLGAAFLLAGLALTLAHPRTRAMFAPPDPAAAPNASNAQRAAMLTAAARMGADRPFLGWGPGTTPLAYPHYRAGLEGGAENVLQLHNTPAQLWAEFGGLGVACALAFGTLVLVHARRHPLAAVTLLGYGVFSLGDWQLDVPIFGIAFAVCAALLAPPAEKSSAFSRRVLGLATLFALALVLLTGRRDPTPELNVRALALASDGAPAHAAEAIALLRDSLAQNPDQEIAHFNLGWLLLVRDPAAAEQHFIAAIRLVPDKGGVYFGLGLARLNQNHPADAARAFALECLNDPRFLTSPWWREPAIAAVRPATAVEFAAVVTRIQKRLPTGSWAALQLSQLARLSPAAPAGPERTYRRERTAYPVLARNLDLPPPRDLYDVRESIAAADAPASPLPPKGWLPSPLLLELLDAPPPPHSH